MERIIRQNTKRTHLGKNKKPKIFYMGDGEKLKRKEDNKMSLKPIKTMLLGIMIMLLGGFGTTRPIWSIILIGLIIGVFGFFQKD